MHPKDATTILLLPPHHLLIHLFLIKLSYLPGPQLPRERWRALGWSCLDVWPRGIGNNVCISFEKEYVFRLAH